MIKLLLYSIPEPYASEFKSADGRSRLRAILLNPNTEIPKHLYNIYSPFIIFLYDGDKNLQLLTRCAINLGLLGLIEENTYGSKIAKNINSYMHLLTPGGISVAIVGFVGFPEERLSDTQVETLSSLLHDLPISIISCVHKALEPLTPDQCKKLFSNLAPDLLIYAWMIIT